MPITHVGLYALAGAVATLLYLRRIDQAECSGRHDQRDEEAVDMMASRRKRSD